MGPACQGTQLGIQLACVTLAVLSTFLSMTPLKCSAAFEVLQELKGSS